MLSYVIVGSGYRAEYFGRIAKTYPALFRALYLCRSSEKAGLMKRHTGVEAVTDVDACLAFHPDFIVIAVDRAHVVDVAEEWIGRGFPVVTETPVGDTMEKLCRLWEAGQRGAKIVCCEQYHRYPILAAGLNAIRQNRIGPVSSMYLSLVHDYHAASLFRKALQIPAGEAYSLRGTRLRNDAVETDSRYGAITDGRVNAVQRDMIHISFDSGKEAIYDFCPIQYRSFIRSRHLTVRGAKGEWSDTQLLYLDDENHPRRLALLPEPPKKYACLDTQALRDKRRNWTAELAPDTVQDEFAIASMLLDMEAYLAGGESPYPLEEALEDAYFWLLAKEAADHPWQEIATEKNPWHP
ncbi:MAG: Gfo/Idh/MocA family oxidoreductase [Clostridia bacterium]|nr:Gfo/Idh/MocA family oxidoreductase [Clostridia bacterium]